MAPNYGINTNDEALLSSTEQVQKKATTVAVAATTHQLSISIPHPSEYNRNYNEGSQAAILRSLRAAGVKFIRFAIVDAYNTIRCKTPLAQLLSGSGQRRTNQTSSPLSNPVSIAEICYC